MSVEREQKLWDALKRISCCYRSPDTLRRTSAKHYGLSPDEAIEFAYENVLEEAKQAVRGCRRPKSPSGGAKP